MSVIVSKDKKFKPDKLVHCRSIPNDQQLFQGLMVASRGRAPLEGGLTVFFLSGFSFKNIDNSKERGGHLFNFSLPLPPAVQALRH